MDQNYGNCVIDAKIAAQTWLAVNLMAMLIFVLIILPRYLLQTNWCGRNILNMDYFEALIRYISGNNQNHED